jgi:hypothetical protein
VPTTTITGLTPGLAQARYVVNPVPIPALLSYAASPASGGFQFAVQAGAVQTMLITVAAGVAIVIAVSTSEGVSDGEMKTLAALCAQVRELAFGTWVVYNCPAALNKRVAGDV